MATLKSPFYSINMLSLIVGALYEPVPEGLYSEKVSFAIKSCLTPDKEALPDIVAVVSLLSDVMMKYLDVLSTSHLMLENKLDQKRRQTHRYFMETNRAPFYHNDCVDGSGSRLRPGKEGTNTTEQGAVKKLPPALQCNLKRRIIERFKKSLFSQQNNPCNLKSEIKKLLQGSPELIEPNIFTADWHGVHLYLGGNMLLPDDRKGILGTSGMAEGMTYEQLQVSLLSERSKELFSKRGECLILNKGFGIVPKEVNLPVLQQRLITSFAH